MHKTKKVLSLILVAHNQAAKVLQPREQPLHLPSSPVAPKFSAILRGSLLPIPLVRRDHFDSSLSQALIERVRVISLIADQPLRLPAGKVLSESVCDKG